jgi:hypothetical protein
MPGYAEKMQALYADYKERVLAVWVTPVSFEVFEQRYLAMLVMQQGNTAVIPVPQPDAAWAVNTDPSGTTTRTTVQQPTSDWNTQSTYKFNNGAWAQQTQPQENNWWGRTLRF